MSEISYDINTTYIIYSSDIGDSFQDIYGNIYNRDSNFPYYTYTNNELYISPKFNFPPTSPDIPINDDVRASMNTVILMDQDSKLSILHLNLAVMKGRMN
jgi:hypothetical protein